MPRDGGGASSGKNLILKPDLHFFYTLWPPSTVAVEKRTTKSPGLNLSGASGPQGVQKIIGCGVFSKYFDFMTLGNEN